MTFLATWIVKIFQYHHHPPPPSLPSPTHFIVNVNKSRVTSIDPMSRVVYSAPHSWSSCHSFVSWNLVIFVTFVQNSCEHIPDNLWLNLLVCVRVGYLIICASITTSLRILKDILQTWRGASISQFVVYKWLAYQHMQGGVRGGKLNASPDNIRHRSYHGFIPSIIQLVLLLRLVWYDQ